MLDLRPNIQVPDYLGYAQNRADPLQALMGGFQQGAGTTPGGMFAKMMQQQKWKSTINQMMNDPNTPPMFKQFAPLLAQNPELGMKVLPSLMRSQAKPTQTVWRNEKTGSVSFSPQAGPDWREVTPQQSQAYSSARSVQERQQWADAWGERVNLQRRFQVYSVLNSLDKSSGNVLGQAGMIQYRSRRGKDLLTTPGIKLDARTYALVQADLAAIAQGGSPTIAAQAEASLPTFKQTANGLLQKITADPTSINQPGVRRQLIAIFDTMGNSAAKVLQQNTQGFMDLYGDDPWIRSHPEEVKKAILHIGMGIQPVDPKTLPGLPPPPNITGGDADTSQLDTQDLLNTLSGGQ